jgi:hypothetical protein
MLNYIGLQIKELLLGVLQGFIYLQIQHKLCLMLGQQFHQQLGQLPSFQEFKYDIITLC